MAILVILSVVFLVIAALAGLAFVFLFYDNRERLETQVKNNSRVYKELLSLKLEIEERAIETKDAWRHVKLNSMQRFNEFDVNECLFDYIKENREFIEELVEQASYNKDLEDIFNKKKAQIMQQLVMPSSSYNEKFRETEERMCSSVVVNVTSNFDVRVSWEYISASGYDKKGKEKRFSLREVEEVFKRLDETKVKNNPMANSFAGALTPKIRYAVMKRDDFRCKVCGRTANDGVKIDVDFIVPLKNGGAVQGNNLQTLCDECKTGKNIKYGSVDFT